MTTTLVRGNLKPDLRITISDSKGQANFTGLATNAYQIHCEQNGVLIVDDDPDSVTVSPDGKSATLVRGWEAGETDAVGRVWVSVDVVWPGNDPQTFPNDEGPLRLDIARAAGDA